MLAGVFRVVERVGKGSYGSVYRALDTTRGDATVAVKVIDKMKLDAATRVQMFQVKQWECQSCQMKAGFRDEGC